MKLIRQSRNSFVRFYEDFGYVSHQRVKLTHIYRGRDRLFLQTLSRTPQPIDHILASLRAQCPDSSAVDIERAYLDFVECLQQEKHVLIGASVDELEQQEFRFSYQEEFVKPKRGVRNPALQRPGDEEQSSASDFLYRHLHRHPRILGAHLDLTSRCNENCVHCYIPLNQRQRTGHAMETDLALRILDQLAAHGTLSLTLSGGEPFMHRDLATILRKARDNDFIITIQSNGTLLKDRHYELLKQVEVSVVQLSFYSLDPSIHDAITGVTGSHAKTLAAINRLVREDIPVAINFVAMKENQESLRDMLMWGGARGIRVNTDFRLIPRNDFDTSNLDHRLTTEETRALMLNALDCENFFINFEDVDIDLAAMETQHICGAGMDQLNIAANGDCYPCAGFHGFRLGNADQQSIEEIWRESAGVKELRAITWQKFPKCLQCEAFKYCANCLARNFNESHGNLYRRSQHSCDIAFMNREVSQARLIPTSKAP